MLIVDLSLPIRSGMPVYPGDPEVTLTPAATLEAAPRLVGRDPHVATTVYRAAPIHLPGTVRHRLNRSGNPGPGPAPHAHADGRRTRPVPASVAAA